MLGGDRRMFGKSAIWALVAVVPLSLLLASCGGDGADGDQRHSEETVLTQAADEPGPSSYLCLACHSQPGLSGAGSWGIVSELAAVAPDGYYTSAHGDVSCADCHQGQSSVPHEKVSPTGAPLVREEASELCRTCHGGPAEHFLDSVHGTAIRLGDERAPACTDCHSAHAVQRIATWTSAEKATACAGCHRGADATFAGSLTHVEPTVDRLPIDFIATRFFGALVVAVVGIGILHVELDLLRWMKGKLTRRKREE